MSTSGPNGVAGLWPALDAALTRGQLGKLQLQEAQREVGQKQTQDEALKVIQNMYRLGAPMPAMQKVGALAFPEAAAARAQEVVYPTPPKWTTVGEHDRGGFLGKDGQFKEVVGPAPSPPKLESIFDDKGNEIKVLMQPDGSYKPVGGAKAKDEETWHTMTPDEVKAEGLPAGNYKRSSRGNTQSITTPQQERIPQGYRIGPNGVDLEFIPGGPADPSIQSPTQKGQLGGIEAEAGTLKSALDDYEKVIDNASIGDFGAAFLGGTSAGGQKLTGAWTNAALMAKGDALFKLGVLSGPDMEVITGALKNPGSTSGQFTSKQAYKQGIQQVRKLVDDRLAAYRKNLGGPAQRAATQQPSGPQMPPGPAPIGKNGKPMIWVPD